jgi:hypothetical protein
MTALGREGSAVSEGCKAVASNEAGRELQRWLKCVKAVSFLRLAVSTMGIQMQARL